VEKQILEFQDLDKNPICNTCHMEIQNYPSRVITMANKLGDPIVLHYHYFFPCWDLSLLFQEYPHHTIISAGFVCDPKMTQNQKLVRNLKQNLDLWD